MTSRDADGPLEIHFRIDDRRGVLSPAVISAALRLRIPPRNAEGYREWAHPPTREIVRALARDATAGPVLYRRQLPPHMLLIDHLLRTCLFPLQHYVHRRGPILEVLYRISGNLWFNPSELVMTSLCILRRRSIGGTSHEQRAYHFLCRGSFPMFLSRWDFQRSLGSRCETDACI